MIEKENNNKYWADVGKTNYMNLKSEWERFVDKFTQDNKNTTIPSRPGSLGEHRPITIFSFVSSCVQMNLFRDVELFNLITIMIKNVLGVL